MDSLPHDAAALLTLALEDMDIIRQDDRYVIDMSNWHGPLGDKCHVCLAGCVIARRLELKPTDHARADVFAGSNFTMMLDAPIRRKLQFIDRVRSMGVTGIPPVMYTGANWEVFRDYLKDCIVYYRQHPEVV